MTRHQILPVLAALLYAAGSFAGTCEIFTTRTACPGKEAVSYKKCNGKPSCSDFQELDNAAQCKAAATAACENARLNITKSKVITAKFDDAELKTDKGSTDFCTVYEKRAAEFDHCDG
jgi:hypothetical protein